MREKRFAKWLLLAAVGIFVIPLAINEAYKFGKGYVTLWNAADALAFYGAVLSFAGTVVLGLVAAGQAKRANDLTSRMLALEESRDFPMVDIDEVTEEAQLSADSRKGSLQVCLNDHHFYIDRDGALGGAEGPVVAVRLVNICPNPIISLAVCDVTKTTTFLNGESVPGEIQSMDYNSGLHVLARDKSMLLLISGAYYDYPPSLTEEELFGRDYVNPAVSLTMTFLLGGAKGKKYRETIKISYTWLPGEDALLCPCIFEKEILSIEEDRSGLT